MPSVSKNGAMLEDLVHRLKIGEPGAALKLWEAVRRFVGMRATAFTSHPDCRVRFDDLMQAGFLAMLDSVEQYDFSRENSSFLSLLTYTLKSHFAAEAGIRTSKRDAMQYADSIEDSAYRDNPDGETVGELLPDDGAALSFLGVEYADFLDYCRREIGASLNTLPTKYANLLKLHYLEGRTLEEAAPLCGFSSKQAASEAEYRALRRLERGSHRRALYDCLEAFNDFHDYEYAVHRSSVERFYNSGTSSTEAAALVKMVGGAP